MTAVRFIPFEAAHLDRFRPGAHDGEVLDEPYIGMLRRHWPGRAVSAELDGRIVGIAGATVASGRAYPWMALSEEMRRAYPILLTRLARRAVAQLFAHDGATCVEATVHPDFAASRRWLERLGFRQAGMRDNRVRYLKDEQP